MVTDRRSTKARVDAGENATVAREQWVVLTVLGGLFCASTLWVVLNLVVSPSTEIGPYGPTALIFWLVLVAAASPFMLRGSRWLGARVDEGRWFVRIGVPAAVLLLGLAAQLVIGWATLREPGFDAQRVYVSAAGLVQDAGPSAPEYYREYPNNIFLLLVLAKYFATIKAFGVDDGDLLMGAVALNAVVMTLGLLLTYLIGRRIGGASIGLLSLLLAAPFVVVSPWIGTPYTDTLGLVFPVAVMWTFLRARDSTRAVKRWTWWGILGVVGAVGYSVKPTVVFAVGAVLLVHGATLARRSSSRSEGRRGLRLTIVEPLAVVATVGAVAVGTLSVVTWAEQAAGVVSFDISSNTQAFPATHFLKMGAQGLGAYNGDDVEETRRLPPSERFGNGIEVYLDRVSAMGPDGYADFLARKQLTTMGDGSFFQWREGDMLKQPFRHDGAFSRAVQDVYGPDGDRHGGLLLAWQVLWVAMLALVSAPLLLRGQLRSGAPETVLRIALLGLTVFLLFFEARSRYVYLYVPFFAILAAVSWDAISQRRAPDRARSVTHR